MITVRSFFTPPAPPCKGGELNLTKNRQGIIFIFLSCIFFSLFAFGQTKPRTIVTTDGEIDDVDSFIRMLLYANEFKLEGLIYSSSMWHYKGDGKGTQFTSEREMTRKIYGSKTELRWVGTTWMNDLLDAYEKVYPNLIKHDADYPTTAYLRSIIRVGNIDFEGEMEKVTEGSEFIKNKLLDASTTPIYLQAWGGSNTIARALKSIEEQYANTPNWSSIKQKVSKKAIIYIIMDQDATYEKYIAKNWPAITILMNKWQFAAWAYNWKKQVPAPFQYTLEGKFMGDNIINNHGPLTKMYYSYGDGQKQAGDDEHIHGDITKIKNGQWGSFNQYDFLSEGDSPAYFHLINVGLNNLKNPSFGGWGGRFQHEKLNKWTTEGVTDYNNFTAKEDRDFPQSRWIEAMQLDFAARADWCVKPFKEANHPPKIIVKGSNTMIAKPNQKIKINVAISDPDNNKPTTKFWQYKEAGNAHFALQINQQSNTEATVTIPSDAQKGNTFHLIAETTDNGTPALTRYQRIIFTVK